MYPAKLPSPRQRTFSCLDARKEPKENQVPCRGRGSLAWYVFENRMLLRSYSTGKSEIKKRERIRYLCRGVLHTPHKYPIKDYFMLHKYTSSPSPEAFVERMQYAPTILQEWNPKNENFPALPENLRSKNGNEKSGYMIRHISGFVFRFMVFVLSAQFSGR